MLVKFLDGSSRDIADLSGANLSSTNLSDADLGGAHLRGAHLRGADLSGANLHNANLSYADLSGANLSSTNLSDADLGGAHLRGAHLRGADLSGANLHNANLSYADLSGADLIGADLSDADLGGAKGLEQHCILAEGAITGYKKLADGSIATLLIPAHAKRVNAYGSRKCRAECAVVISGGGPGRHDEKFVYVQGVCAYPDKFDPDPRVECSHGIHFFITRAEAEVY